VHGFQTKRNKNSGGKIKFGPPSPGPLGGDFYVYFEDIRRRSVRVLKLHRGFILTKKDDINPQKIGRPPLAPWGGGGAFLKKFFF
jgi:hypothetical protein